MFKVLHSTSIVKDIVEWRITNIPSKITGSFFLLKFLTSDKDLLRLAGSY